jgi:hypothetical protein
MVDEREIPRQPTACFRDCRRSQRMKNYSNFYALPSIFQFENAKDGFIECSLGLYDVIVNMIDGRINWNSRYQARVSDAAPRIHYL